MTAINNLGGKQLRYFSDLMADAFYDYPLYTFSIPNERTRRIALPYLFEALLRFTSKHGRIYATKDDRAVSLWLPPSKTGISPPQFILSGGINFIREVGVTASLLLGRLIDQRVMHRKEAGKVDCWYLYTIAVDPTFHGKGLGKKLIQEAVESIQPENGIWLETCNRKNAEVFASLGFKFCNIEKMERTPIHTHGMFAETLRAS